MNIYLCVCDGGGDFLIKERLKEKKWLRFHFLRFLQWRKRQMVVKRE